MGRVIRGARTLPAERVEAVLSATEVETKAREEAERILSAARDEAVTIRERAQAKGVDDANSLAAATLAEASRRREMLLEGVQDDIITLALQVAGRVIRREVKTNPEILANTCRDSIEQLVLAKTVQIRVNPGDCSVLEEQNELVSEGLTQGASLRIVGDETIERGGCIVESDMGRIDARLETQLAAFAKAMKRTDD